MAKSKTGLSPAEERTVVKKLNEFIAEGTTHCDPKHSRCEENIKYVRGDQWSASDLLRQAARERPALSINSTFKVVGAIANRETVERLVPVVFGRSEKDNGIANVLNEATRWQRQTALSEHYESSAFRGATIGGYGVVHKYWNPTVLNGDGMIADEDVPVWEMLWPNRARETNLADRRWHVRGKWVDVETVENLWGHKNPKLKKKVKDWRNKKETIFVDTSTDMGKVSGVSGWGWSAIKRGIWTNSATKEVFVVEAEWRELEPQFRAAIPVRFAEWVDFVSGVAPFMIEGPPDEYGNPSQIPVELEQYMQLPPEEQDKLKYMVTGKTEIARYESKRELEDFSNMYEQVFGMEFVDWAEKSKEVIKYAVMSDGVVIDYGDRPWGFSYYFITGFPFEQVDGMDFYGAVDIIKGPQDFKNAFLSNALAMYMSSPKSPIIIDEDAAPNIQTIANKVASPSAIVTVPKGFVGSEGTKWKILDSPTFPPMMDYLLRVAEAGVEGSMGLSPIDTNTQGDLRRVSGTVVSAAKTASNVIVANLFDSLRKFRKEYALCNLRFITKMYTPQEIIRIVGEEKAEDIVGALQNNWNDVIKLDVTIDEQPSSPSEQLEVFSFMTSTGLLNEWTRSGQITMEDALEFIPMIPESRKRKILKNKRISEMYMQLQQEHQKSQILMDGLVQIVQESGGEQILQQFQQMAQEVEMQAQQQPGQPSAGQPPA